MLHAVLLTMDVLFPQNVGNVTTLSLVLSAVLNYIDMKKSRMIDSSGKAEG